MITEPEEIYPTSKSASENIVLLQNEYSKKDLNF